MSSEHHSHEESAPLETLNLVLQLCDEFEDAWVWGNRPVLAEFIKRIPSGMRAKILPDLLRLDIELRIDKGESPQIDDYLERLGEHELIVREVFSRVAPKDGGSIEAS